MVLAAQTAVDPGITPATGTKPVPSFVKSRVMRNALCPSFPPNFLNGRFSMSSS
jgi:hypothetical protein